MADDFVTVNLIITNPTTGEKTNKEMQIQRGIAFTTSKNDEKKHQSIYITDKTKSLELNPDVASILEAISVVDGDSRLSKHDIEMLKNASNNDISLFMSSAQEKAKENGASSAIDSFTKNGNTVKIVAKDSKTYDSQNLEI